MKSGKAKGRKREGQGKEKDPPSHEQTKLVGLLPNEILIHLIVRIQDESVLEAVKRKNSFDVFHGTLWITSTTKENNITAVSSRPH